MVGTIKPAQPKLSHEIARQISRDIVEHGYKEGEFLGQEPDLLKRYNISRDTFREAVRVLEWQSLAKTTRGSGGGLVVAKQSQDAIVSILRDYFDLTDITFKEVTEARRRLQQVAVRLATIRLTEDVIPRLEELLANAIKRDKNLSIEMLSHIQLIQEIAQVSNNRALSLFISPLDYVSLDFADIESLSKVNLQKGREQSLTILKEMVSGWGMQPKSATTNFRDPWTSVMILNITFVEPIWVRKPRT